MAKKEVPADVRIDIGDMYRNEAEECQQIIAELTSDVRLFACPDAFITKVNRLAEIWGVDHRDKAN
jgi:hypothetical protein